MLKLYVPSTHLSGEWLDVNNTAVSSTDWVQTQPGAVYNSGDVCSADYRSDKNIVATQGMMGERLTYTFLPFIIKNDFPSPHTFMFDIGFSDPILDPSAKTTGLDAAGNVSEVAEPFSHDGSGKTNANYSNNKFKSYLQDNFGFKILGISTPNTELWNLQSTFYWNDWDFAFQVDGTRFSIHPEVLAEAYDYTYSSGRSSGTMPVSDENDNLGSYRPYLYKSNMKLFGSPSFMPGNDQPLILSRGDFMWGFFYFSVLDNMTGDKTTANKKYETNLITSGDAGDPGFLLPGYNDFQITRHGEWSDEMLGQGANPEAKSRNLWWGTMPRCRESRAGWFVAGRRVD